MFFKGSPLPPSFLYLSGQEARRSHGEAGATRAGLRVAVQEGPDDSGAQQRSGPGLLLSTSHPGVLHASHQSGYSMTSAPI